MPASLLEIFEWVGGGAFGAWFRDWDLESFQQGDGGFEGVEGVVVVAAGEGLELVPQELGEVVAKADPSVGDEGFECGDAHVFVLGVGDFPDGDLPCFVVMAPADALFFNGEEEEALEAIGFDAEEGVVPEVVKAEDLGDLCGGWDALDPGVEDVVIAVGVEGDGEYGGVVAVGVFGGASGGGVEEAGDTEKG